MRLFFPFFAGVLVPLGVYSQVSPSRPAAGALTTYNTQVVPLVIVGEGWSQRILLTDVDQTHVVAGTVRFFTQTGQP